MKVKFWCDTNSGTGKGQNTQVFDLEKDFGLTVEEWNDLSEFHKEEYVEHWVHQTISYGWEEQS